MSRVLVLDCGSGFVKAGFSGEDEPRLVIPTIIAENSGKFSFGKNVWHLPASEDLQVIRPMERCDLKDPESMIKLWEFIYHELNIESEKFAV